MKELQSYIQTYFGLGGNDLLTVQELFEYGRLVRSDKFLQAGQPARSLSFVVSGYCRVYALDQSGEREITQWIAGPSSFITDLSSLIFESPSRWTIEALSDCELYSISRANYKRLHQISPTWPQLEKLFLAKCFTQLENRMFEQLSLSAEERVLKLVEVSPDLFLHVPLHYIASMLGITPETLSRIRKKLSS